MRLRSAASFLLFFLAAAPLRAEYVVLRSGQRLSVTAYERRGDAYRLHLPGGFVEVPAGDIAAFEPEELFAPAPAVTSQKAPYHELIQEAAQRYGVDADLVTSVIAVESNFDPRAVSRRNARGLMQLLPETATRYGVKDVFDPRENIEAGTRYLRELLERYGRNVLLAVAAYNAGPERVEQYGSVPPYAETRSYVRRVQRSYDKRKVERRGSQRTNRASAKKKARPNGTGL